MLDSNMLRLSANDTISKERVEEIFAVPKTKELWDKVKSHKNYERMFYPVYGCRILENEDMDVLIKIAMIEKAMVDSVKTGATFDDSVQKFEKEMFEELETITEDHLNMVQAQIDGVFALAGLLNFFDQ